MFNMIAFVIACIQPSLWATGSGAEPADVAASVVFVSSPPRFSLPEYLQRSPVFSLEESDELWEAGEYAKALPGFLREYSNHLRTIGALREDERDSTFNALSQLLLKLGNSFEELGDYSQAEVALIWYSRIAEECWAGTRRGSTGPASWLSAFYEAIGNLGKARELRIDSFCIMESRDGNKVALNEALNNIRGTASDIVGPEQESSYYMFLRIMRDIIERGTDAEAQSAVNNLDGVLSQIPEDQFHYCFDGLLIKARYLLRTGAPESAIQLVTRAAEKLDVDFRNAVQDGVDSFLASAMLQAGRFEQAKSYFDRLPGRTKRKSELGISLLLESGDEAGIREAQKFQEALIAEQSREVLAMSSEEQRIRYFQSLKPYALPLAVTDDEGVARNALRYKGIVLDSILQDSRSRQHSTDPATRSLEMELLRARQDAHRLLRRAESSEVEVSEQARATQRYRDALAVMDGIEARLARVASGYGLVSKALALVPGDVLQKLPAGTCLLDYVIAQRYTGRGRYEPECILVRYWQGRVTIHQCGDLSDILESVNAIKTAMRQNSPPDGLVHTRLMELHRQIIGETLTDLPQDSKVFISPDGALNFVPFAALLAKDGQMLMQRFELAYLASARDMLNLPSGGRPQSVLLIGDPDYSLASDRTHVLLQHGYLAARSMGLDRTAGTRVYLPRLPGTRDEIESLKRLFQQHGVSASSLLDKDATESSLRRAKEVSLIHIATHGMVLDSGQKDTFSPMTSGIITLAGAQHTLDHWHKGEVGDTFSDGIVSADEFSRMDLSHVHTLVLSACDTGLGKTEQGEGVMGLRRGLHQAGVNQLLLTLWPIDDAATVEMMRSFYEKLVGAGNTASVAITATQREELARLTRERGLGVAVKLVCPFVLSIGSSNRRAGESLAAASATAMEPSPARAPADSSPVTGSLAGERFPVTRSQLLGPDDLQSWSEADLRYAINEMFARHGATFPKNQEVQQRFDDMAWYRPRIGLDFNTIEADFNEIERANLLVLGAVRDQRKGEMTRPQGGLPGERFSETRMRYLSREELLAWSKTDVRYAINEMFARHGATFPKSPEIQKHFEGMSWYQPRSSSSYDEIEQQFNEYEAENVKVLGLVRDQQKSRAKK